VGHIDVRVEPFLEHPGHRHLKGGFFRRILNRFRQMSETAETPSGPCATALRNLVEHPMFALVTTLYLLVYLAVLVVTGPRPDKAEEQKLLLQVSFVGVVIWGIELQLKVFGLGVTIFFLNGWHVLQLVSYVSLLADICGLRGIALVYLRCLELMRHLAKIFQLVPVRYTSSHVWEMTIRTVTSGNRMVRTVFLTLLALPPILCMFTVFLLLLALLGHNLFGTPKADFLRNRCVTETSPYADAVTVFLQQHAKEVGEIEAGKSSSLVHTMTGGQLRLYPGLGLHKMLLLILSLLW
jgi:hypothetical protein